MLRSNSHSHSSRLQAKFVVLCYYSRMYQADIPGVIEHGGASCISRTNNNKLDS